MRVPQIGNKVVEKAERKRGRRERGGIGKSKGQKEREDGKPIGVEGE